MTKPLRLAATTTLVMVLLGVPCAGVLRAERSVAAAQEPKVGEQVSQLLRQPRAAAESTIDALVALGPAAIEPTLEALRDESVGLGETLIRLPPRTLDVLRKALARFDHAELIERLRVRAAFAEGTDDRRVVIEVLGLLGSAADLDLLFEAATPQDGSGCDSRWTTVAQRALEQFFKRHPSALEPAAKRLPAAHIDFAPALARAIASNPHPSSFDLLAGALGHRPELDLVVILNLPKTAGCYSSPLRARALDLVRADLTSDEPMLARVAAEVCGDLGDALAAAKLCELLESSDAQLVVTAHVALKKLSGLAFPAQRARWQQWFQAEDAWVRSEAELVLGQLESQDKDEVLQALQELVLHPLYRDTLARKVLGVTGRSEPELRVFACTVLGRLRAPASIPALRELERDTSQEVADAAGDALRLVEGPSTASK